VLAALDMFEFAASLTSMPRRLKAPESESFCDSSALRAISSLLERNRINRPVTNRETTPTSRVALPTALVCSSFSPANRGGRP
jgi:hypothetical protein